MKNKTYRTAEIIVVGSEFFTRLKKDTNSLWLTEQLERRGVRVLAKRTVADELEALTRAYRDAMNSVDLVLSTGGLGPTVDDRTRDAFARALGVELEYRPEIAEEIAARFRARGREMSENNKRQAFIPAGAAVLPNAGGTAPGFHSRGETSTLVALPGPPNEMTPLFEQFVDSHQERFPTDEMVTVGEVLRVTGLGESDMDRRICDLYEGVDNPEVTVNFSGHGLEIHLTARARSQAEAQSLIEPLVEKMSQRLDGYLFSTCDEPLEVVVSRLLKSTANTIGLAESVTGGLMASKLASVPGASELLKASLVTYTNEAKHQLLGVEQTTLDEFGAVSEQVAREMVEGARQRTGASLAMSCTGYAGPGGGTESDPVGTCYIGFATPEKTSVKRISLPGSRNVLRARIAQMMLFMLFRYLRKEKSPA